MKLADALLRCAFDCLLDGEKVESIVLVDVGAMDPDKRVPSFYLEEARIDALLQTGASKARLTRVERMYRPHT